MKRSVLFVLFLVIVLQGYTQPKVDIENLLTPVPVSVTQHDGHFRIGPNIAILLSSDNADAIRVANFLKEKLNAATGFPISVTNTISNRNVLSGIISLQLVQDNSLGNEGYKLNVDQKNITLTAQQPAGLFYGMQTLFQLLPAEIEGTAVAGFVDWTVPACTITDNPRFSWRGLMLDVVRHFFTKEEVKGFIDEMVKYKFNLLHMHLTDDEGWRIEIKSLPKLIEVGAWRVEKTGSFGTFSAPGPDEERNYGGYYTHDDIKEIIQYAKDRFVDIMPEVDVPGHSMAAIASYPYLASSKVSPDYQVRTGEPIIDWSKGYALIDNTLDPASERVYDFLDKVFTEVAELFPFEYIHLGGDECFKNFWEKSDAVKALMKKEKLKNMNEVQSYFVTRAGKIIESKGKKFIGWDEILEGGLAPSAAVMSWRGVKGGIEAAKMNHEVVMSPTTFAYLDYMQGDKAIESHVYASLSLKKAYEFDPLPEGVDPKFIKGGQGNLWTEQIYNNRYRQYMLWPRALAIAEAVWSPMQRRNWNSFVSRVEKQLSRLDAANVKYATSMFEPQIIVSRDGKGQLQVQAGTEAHDISIHYSFDNSFPNQYYAAFGNDPVIVPKDASLMKLAPYRGNKQMGRYFVISVEDLKGRLPKK